MSLQSHNLVRNTSQDKKFSTRTAISPLLQHQNQEGGPIRTYDARLQEQPKLEEKKLSHILQTRSKEHLTGQN